MFKLIRQTLRATSKFLEKTSKDIEIMAEQAEYESEKRRLEIALQYQKDLEQHYKECEQFAQIDPKTGIKETGKQVSERLTREYNQLLEELNLK